MGKRNKKSRSEARAASRAETERIMRRLQERIAYHKGKLAEEARARDAT